MKKLYAALIAAIFFLTAGAAVFFPTVTAAAEEEISYTWKEINSEQGADGWYYMYGDPRGAYYLASWDETLTRWATSETYAAIGADGNLHPGNSLDVMMVWRAPCAGSAYAKAKITGVNGEDGIRFSLLRRTKTEIGFAASAEEVSEDYPQEIKPGSGEKTFENRDIAVSRGDLLLFVVNKNGNNAGDSNHTDCAVTFVPAAGETPDDKEIDPYADLGVQRVVDPTAWYGDTQGAGGWFTAYGRPDRYVLMRYGTCEDGIAWHGVERYSNITRDGMHPGGLFGVMRIWVAEVSGTVALEGTITKNGSGGDGVNAGIYHNNQPLWEKKFERGETDPIPAAYRFHVKQGDTVVLYLDSGDNYNNTGDSFSYRTELYYVERAADETPLGAEQLAGKLSAYSHADFVGVIRLDKDKTGNFNELSQPGLSVGAIAGIAVGGVIVVAGAVTIGIVIRRKKRHA